MINSPQLTSEHLNEIIKDEVKTVKVKSEVQAQVEDGKEVIDYNDSSSALRAVPNTIKKQILTQMS